MGLGSGGPTALRAGRKLSENLGRLKERFRITTNGYFGEKGQGRSHTRNIRSDNPAKTAAEFASIAGYSPVSVTTIAGKGIVRTMRDGSVVTH